MVFSIIILISSLPFSGSVSSTSNDADEDGISTEFVDGTTFVLRSNHRPANINDLYIDGEMLLVATDFCGSYYYSNCDAYFGSVSVDVSDENGRSGLLFEIDSINNSVTSLLTIPGQGYAYLSSVTKSGNRIFVSGVDCAENPCYSFELDETRHSTNIQNIMSDLGEGFIGEVVGGELVWSVTMPGLMSSKTTLYVASDGGLYASGQLQANHSIGSNKTITYPEHCLNGNDTMSFQPDMGFLVKLDPNGGEIDWIRYLHSDTNDTASSGGTNIVGHVLAEDEKFWILSEYRGDNLSWLDECGKKLYSWQINNSRNQDIAIIGFIDRNTSNEIEIISGQGDDRASSIKREGNMTIISGMITRNPDAEEPTFNGGLSDQFLRILYHDGRRGSLSFIGTNRTFFLGDQVAVNSGQYNNWMSDMAFDAEIIDGEIILLGMLCENVNESYSLDDCNLRQNGNLVKERNDRMFSNFWANDAPSILILSERGFIEEIIDPMAEPNEFGLVNQPRITDSTFSDDILVFSGDMIWDYELNESMKLFGTPLFIDSNSTGGGRYESASFIWLKNRNTEINSTSQELEPISSENDTGLIILSTSILILLILAMIYTFTSKKGSFFAGVLIGRVAGGKNPRWRTVSGEATREQIISALEELGEMRQSALSRILNISRTQVSHHLPVLISDGLVIVDEDGLIQLK